MRTDKTSNFFSLRKITEKIEEKFIGYDRVIAINLSPKKQESVNYDSEQNNIKITCHIYQYCYHSSKQELEEFMKQLNISGNIRFIVNIGDNDKLQKDFIESVAEEVSEQDNELSSF